jgi:hypothetical protein
LFEPALEPDVPEIAVGVPHPFEERRPLAEGRRHHGGPRTFPASQPLSVVNEAISELVTQRIIRSAANPALKL